MEKKKYLLKSSGAKLYTWSPEASTLTPGIKKTNQQVNSNRNYFCTATPNSQGEDSITKYVYDLVVVDYVQKKYAYVQCDYVE